jgi:hypothetical protein
LVYYITKFYYYISEYNPFSFEYDDTRHINTLLSVTFNSANVSSSNTYRRIDLSEYDLNNGCKLGLDTWADTSCVGKHAHIDSYIEGRTVTARGFASNLPSLDNIPIVNCSFAYDTNNGKTLLLQVNNALYMGENMEHSLLCPNQCEDNDIRIDLRPSLYYPNEIRASTLYCENNNIVIPIHHHGPLPYINVRRPTNEELLVCDIIQLTSTNDWNPYEQSNLSSTINQVTNDDYPKYFEEDMCPISTDLMYNDIHQQLISSIQTDYDSLQVSALATRKKDKITAEQLMKLWGIGLATAKRTINATTHQCLSTIGTLRRRFRTDRAHMRYKRLTTRHGRFYVDTLFSKVKSIRGYTCGNVFTNSLGFKKFFPLRTESEGQKSMVDFIQLVGIPHALHSDNAKVFMHGEFKRTCRKYDIQQTFTEPYSPWQNRAESAIREIKAFASKIMQRKNAPIRLWCFAYEYACDILSLCANSFYPLKGRTSYEHVLNYTPDISEYVTFEWYQWSYYWDEIAKEKTLCRWLGVAHHIGQCMCYYVLKSDGSFIARSTVIPIPDSDIQSEDMKTQMTAFTDKLHATIGNHDKGVIGPYKVDDDDKYNDAMFYDKSEDDMTYPWDSELHDQPLHDETEITQKDLDQYIGANVLLPGSDGVEVLCRVKGRKRRADGSAIGVSNPNPILDTRIFEVEYPDGHVDAYSTNVIAESLYANTDEEGNSTGLLDEIVDHRKSNAAIDIKDGLTGTDKKPVITTKGWQIRIRWKDGSHDWLPLSQVKNSNPIELAEYAVACNIDREPAFNWWANKVLKKRTRMINRVATRMKKNNMKFGILIPTTVAEATEEDRKNGNTYWKDAIAKEYENVKVAFKLLDDGLKVPPGYTEITCHLVFEVKFDLRRKARYVAGGHLTSTPAHLTYSSVVSRESVRIGFLIAALNDLDIWAADIQNAYLNAPTKEKVWFKAGDEWGEHKGKPIMVVRALYGLKGSGQAWRSFLADTLKNTLGFTSSYADPDVWYKAATKKDGTKYYTYLLIYVDDVICIDEHPRKYIEQIGEVFKIKEGSAGPPTVYLGANIQKLESRSQGECWGMSCEQYVRDSIKNVKERLKNEGWEFNKRLSDVNYSPQQPFSNVKYRPELDVSNLCSDHEGNYFQNLIGVLRWIVELGRIDINFEVASLSSFLANPRRGHLHQALHIFKYLDIHKESFLSFDPTYLDLGEPLDAETNPNCKQKIMKEFYPDAEEAIPTNCPEPRGKPVQINTFVDADHAGDSVTRRSVTGILIYLNMAPISWYSKKQNTVESSTYSSEFMALKIAAEKIISLRYKLRMFGIPIDGRANVFCDNEAVYKGASIGASTLKKKHNSIAYHKVRECTASNILMVYKEETGSNLADILTKALGKEQRLYLRQRIMYNQKVKILKSKESNILKESK